MANKVTLCGRLGADPEIRYNSQKTAFATLSIATSEHYRNAKGDLVEDTQWHRVVLRGKTAENAHKYGFKGQLVLVFGKLTHRKYTDKDGADKFITEVLGNEYKMLSRKPADKEDTAEGVQTGIQDDFGSEDDLPF